MSGDRDPGVCRHGSLSGRLRSGRPRCPSCRWEEDRAAELAEAAARQRQREVDRRARLARIPDYKALQANDDTHRD